MREINPRLQPRSSDKLSHAQAPAKGSETKKWAGLGQTAAALAQLEWQNRKLAQDAGRAHERALEAEAKVAEMAKVEQLCTQLSQVTRHPCCGNCMH